jgi:hypothetical protein
LDDSMMGPGEFICVAKNKLSDDSHAYVWVNKEGGTEHKYYCRDQKT